MISLLCASFLFATAQVEVITFVAFNGSTKVNTELYCSGSPLTLSNYRLSDIPAQEIASEMVKNSQGEVEAVCPVFIKYNSDPAQATSNLFLNAIVQLTKLSANCFYGNSSVCTTTVIP